MKKRITRKDFIVKTITGMTGFGIISKIPTVGSGPEINYRELGDSGLSVSPVCFGSSRTNNEALIKYALDKGINFIDTGRSYSNGNNERLVGKAVKGKREKVVIQSKIRLDNSDLLYNGKGKKGGEEIRSVLSGRLEESLKALETEYIDILLYHDASEEQLLFHPETINFFREMKEKGMIRLSGFSTHNDCMELVSRNNRELIYDNLMIPFNYRGSYTHSLTGVFAEWDQAKLIGLLKEASGKGRSVIAMKTCSGGPYAGIDNNRSGYSEAVKWVLSHDFISAAAIAIATFEQLEDHLALLNL